MKKIIILPFILSCGLVYAAGLSGEDILKKIDENYTSKKRRSISTMIVKTRRGIRTLKAESWIQGTEKAFTEYLAPPREAGTKMLKLENQLWLYSPTTDRTIKIAGHMLKQSLMGSDVSYEDYMEDPKLINIYTPVVIGEGTEGDRDCYILELTAKEEGVSYHSRKMWVDKQRFIPLREERFAKSGKLLKTLVVSEVFKVDGRWYPKRMVFKDVLKTGDGTEFILESIEFDAKIPEYIFSKAALRK